MRHSLWMLALLVGCDVHGTVDSDEIDFGHVRSAFKVSASNGSFGSFVYLSSAAMTCEDFQRDYGAVIRPHLLLPEPDAEACELADFYEDQSEDVTYAYFDGSVNSSLPPQAALTIELDRDIGGGAFEFEGNGDLEASVTRFGVDSWRATAEDAEWACHGDGEMQEFDNSDRVSRWRLVDGFLDTQSDDEGLDGELLGTMVSDTGERTEVEITFHAEPCELEISGNGDGSALGGVAGLIVALFRLFFGW